MENFENIKVFFFFILFSVVSIYGLQAQEIKQDTNSTSVFKRNLVSISASDIYLKRFLVEYSYLLDTSGKFVFATSFLYSFDDRVLEVYHSDIHWWLDFRFRYFHYGQTRLRLYSGFEIKLISATEFYFVGGYADRKFFKEVDRLFVLVNLGIQYDITNSIVFSVNTGAGLQKGAVFIFDGNVSLGFKF